MCDPISLIGLGLSAAGTIANNAAIADANKARNAALAAERIRQQGLERQQSALSDESAKTMQDFKGDQEGRTMDLTEYFQEPTASDANAEAGMVAPEGASSITVRELGKQSGQATARANQDAANLARMRSFGDLMGDRMRGIQRNSSQIDQLTGFRRGSSDVLASEMEAAAQEGQGKGLLGDLLGGVGSIVGSYGAMAGASNPKVTNWVDKTNTKIKGWLGY